MGRLIKVATLSDVPPGTCWQVDAGGRAVAVFNVVGPYARSVGHAPIGVALLGRANWMKQSSPARGTALRSNVTTGQVVGPPAEQSVWVYRVVVDGETSP
jgi:nitrite reductase/ring-hydroxylating ferredoxin subunit